MVIRHILLAAAVLLGSVAPAAASGLECGWGSFDDRGGEYAMSLSYDELSQLPLDHRRLVFDRMSPASKSQVWVAHLDLQLADEALSPFERDVIESARDLVSEPAFFGEVRSRRWDAKYSGALLDLQVQAAELFEKRRLVQIFATLGENESPKATVYFSGASSPGQEGGGLCDCHSTNGSLFCPGTSTCKVTTSCVFRTQGCGFFFLQACDGLCFAV